MSTQPIPLKGENRLDKVKKVKWTKVPASMQVNLLNLIKIGARPINVFQTLRLYLSLIAKAQKAQHKLSSFHIK